MSTVAEMRATEEDISNDNDLHTSEVQTSRKVSGICSVRHGLSIILLLCNFAIVTQEMNMSIAIPAMVKPTAPLNHSNAYTERSPTDSQEYWNETLKGFKAV
uniref:Uncharacterized protein n=1 Tax=Loxodonta africana TaxID=9785 RepID=G3TPX4_LOXAF